MGKNEVMLGGDNVIYVTVRGKTDEKIAMATKEKCLKIFQETKGYLNVLIDLNKAGKSTSSARKIWKELNDHKKTGKVAFWGIHPVSKVLASFVMGLSRNRAMLFFKTKEEALAWLRE